jgi:hypothetical protein
MNLYSRIDCFWRLERGRFNPGKVDFGCNNGRTIRIQTESKMMPTVCKHPRVRIVSRHDDAEFVECLECGEVFDSEEFHDMEIEETVETEEAESDY